MSWKKNMLKRIKTAVIVTMNNDNQQNRCSFTNRTLDIFLTLRRIVEGPVWVSCFAVDIGVPSLAQQFVQNSSLIDMGFLIYSISPGHDYELPVLGPNLRSSKRDHKKYRYLAQMTDSKTCPRKKCVLIGLEPVYCTI